MAALSRFILPVILYGLTLAFGFWLSQLGKPYNGLLFNVHKLIALAAVVVTVVQLTRMPLTVSPWSLVALLVLAVIGVIALFVSGALLSAGQLDYVRMLLIHRIGLVVLTLDLGLAAYWLRPLV